jgi:hypothetical protein
LQKRDGGVAQGIGPEFKLQYHKKKKENDYNGKAGIGIVGHTCSSSYSRG